MDSHKTIRLKRVYAPPAKDDGFRVLVDRLWPRGLTKSRAKIDLWANEITPSTDLRRWYGHESEKWAEFQIHYQLELEDKQIELIEFMDSLPVGKISLLYGTKMELINHAIVLKDHLVSNFDVRSEQAINFQ